MPSAVIIPAAPALVPAVGGRTPELEEVRRAALEGVQDLLARPPRRVVVIADADRDADESARLDLRGYGVSTSSDAAVPLPLPFATAAWLLDEAGWAGARAYVRPTSQPPAADDTFLIVADGTACRSDRAPGHLDPRAEGVDARLTEALATGVLTVLDQLDAEVVAELMIAGLPALSWLRRRTAAHPVAADLTFHGAPLGVGSWVARWSWSDLEPGPHPDA